VRFEDAYLVTQDGCEVLTTHLSGVRNPEKGGIQA